MLIKSVLVAQQFQRYALATLLITRIVGVFTGPLVTRLRLHSSAVPLKLKQRSRTLRYAKGIQSTCLLVVFQS